MVGGPGEGVNDSNPAETQFALVDAKRGHRALGQASPLPAVVLQYSFRSAGNRQVSRVGAPAHYYIEYRSLVIGIVRFLWRARSLSSSEGRLALRGFRPGLSG